MHLFDVIAILITLCALFVYVNHLYLRLPTTIGVMLISLFVSLGLALVGHLVPGARHAAEQMIEQLQFDDALMHGMLGLLLFAGALHVDVGALMSERGVVFSLATVGVALSTLVVGGGAHLLFGALGLELRLIDCLVFGALISPTDPIAVLAILRQAQAPDSLRTNIVGESMFNDGVGVVVFLALLGIATGRADASASSIAALFFAEAVGGVLYGLVIGYATYAMLRRVDNYQVEVLLTLALVMGGYALARALHTSGPLAMVVAGLLIGNRGRAFAMSERTREHLDTFWELVDEILNAVLFALIGFELLVLELAPGAVVAGLLAIPLVLVARFVAVSAPLGVLRHLREHSPHVIKVLTWGGLRGGISIALALSLPAGPVRELLLVVTYVVVAFSILVQGLTIGPLLRRLFGQGVEEKTVAAH